MSDLPENAPSMLAAAVILDELVALGVTDIVCCPGSRSAPLVYAAADQESKGRIRLHMRLDERAAGYFGLGIAKSSGRAVAVITTSGTAVANLAPSLAEARYARVPLIALTADRPATLVGTGANQTADQVGIFGTIPLLLARISATDLAPAAWRAVVRRVVVTAQGQLTRQAGPVHLNIELPFPLVGQIPAVPPSRSFHIDAPSQAVPVELPPGPRTVIVAGDMGVDQGRWWWKQAERTRTPLLAEPSSNARCGSSAIAGYRYLVSGFSNQIERVVLVGHPTVSRSVTALLSRTDIEIIAVDACGQWSDPGWAVSAVFSNLVLSKGDPTWMKQWLDADRLLRNQIDSEKVWSGHTVAAVVIETLTETDKLVLGASNPIRDADLAPISPHPPQVYSNRGLSGIDGTIATACGIAAAGCEPVVALVGDLTAIHDISSLAKPVWERSVNLKVVIADDHGGSLFSCLEYPQVDIGEPNWFERLFALPMDIDLALAIRGFGVAVVEVNSLPQLCDALRTNHEGLQVIHASLDRYNRAEYEQQLTNWGTKAASEAARPS